MTVDHCTVFENYDNTTGSGAGIRNTGATASLTILDSTIIENFSFGGVGGGIYNDTGTVMIANSAISENMSLSMPVAGGGGIYDTGVAAIENVGA